MGTIIKSMRFSPEVLAHAWKACLKLGFEVSKDGEAIKLMALTGNTSILGPSWQREDPDPELLQRVIAGCAQGKAQSQDGESIACRLSSLYGKPSLGTVDPIEEILHNCFEPSERDSARRVWDGVQGGYFTWEEQLSEGEPINRLAARLCWHTPKVWETLSEETHKLVKKILDIIE